jgi:hypothetical protein
MSRNTTVIPFRQPEASGQANYHAWQKRDLSHSSLPRVSGIRDAAGRAVWLSPQSGGASS